MAIRMEQRRGTAAEWAASNPILGDGELGWERDTGIVKIGDGVTAWNALPTYFILRTIVDAKGDLIVGTADNVVGRLARGTTGQRLTVKADGSLGWEDESVITVIDSVGDLLVGSADNTASRLPHGATGSHLEVQADGTLAWVAMPAFELAAHAASTFETQAHAAATYETLTAAALEETLAHAAAMFETQAHAVATYETIANDKARARKWTRNFMMMGA